MRLLFVATAALVLTARTAVAQAPTTTPPAAPAADEPPEEEKAPPRERYNDGLHRYRDADWERASAQFLSSRDDAGTDNELRYRAAFNLGLAHAAQADDLAEESPEEAIEQLRHGAAWFRDAIRQRPADDDTRINLELVLLRIQLLADQLNQGQNSLEARLDRVIDDQRGLRDRIRQLLSQVDAAGAGSEPVRFQTDFDQLATMERTLLADSGIVSDLAGDELSLLQGKGEEQLTDQERMRLAQLMNLDVYLQQARQSLAGARFKLRRLEGERAHRRADRALAELKRAREQLRDPVAVLKSIFQDESLLMAHTNALAQLRQGELRVSDDDAPPAKPPPWLTREHLGERQNDARERTAEVHSRFASTVEAQARRQNDAQQQQAPADAKTERILASAAEAVPHLEDALAAMETAATHLNSDALRDALGEEARASEALFRAIERFAGVRDLIELAHAEQSGVVGLLTPPEELPAEAAEALAALPTDQRIERVRDSIDHNRDRLTRLEALLQEERQGLEQQAGAAAQEGGGDPAQAQEQVAAIGQRYDRAAELRAAALTSLETMATALEEVAAGGGDVAAPRRAATETLIHIEELRRLFFSIVEHLKELLQNQSSSHDETASINVLPDEEEKAIALGPLADRQSGHASMGDALAQALEQQADAAAAQPSDDPQAAQGAEALAQAAVEVRTGTGEMQSAALLLSEARDQAGMVSYDLEPAQEHQLMAMERLENAIRLLEPHSQQPQQQPQDGQQGDQQQQPQPGEGEEQLSQRQAERRLQAIREREAERQRERRERQRVSQEPVEKDW